MPTLKSKAGPNGAPGVYAQNHAEPKASDTEQERAWQTMWKTAEAERQEK